MQLILKGHRSYEQSIVVRCDQAMWCSFQRSVDHARVRDTNICRHACLCIHMHLVDHYAYAATFFTVNRG
jgi:hypothetical protein